MAPRSKRKVSKKKTVSSSKVIEKVKKVTELRTNFDPKMDMIACRHCPLKCRRENLSLDNICEHIVAHQLHLAKKKRPTPCMYCKSTLISYDNLHFNREKLIHHLQTNHFNLLIRIGTEKMEHVGFFKHFFHIIKASAVNCNDPSVGPCLTKKASPFTRTYQKIRSSVMNSSSGLAVTEIVEEMRKMTEEKRKEEQKRLQTDGISFSLSKWTNAKLDKLARVFDGQELQLTRTEVSVPSAASSALLNNDSPSTSREIFRWLPVDKKPKPPKQQPLPAIVEDAASQVDGTSLRCDTCFEIFSCSKAAFSAHLVYHLSGSSSRTCLDQHESKTVQILKCALCSPKLYFHQYKHLLCHFMNKHSDQPLLAVMPTLSVAKKLKCMLCIVLQLVGNTEFSLPILAGWTRGFNACDIKPAAIRSTVKDEAVNSAGGGSVPYVHALDLMNLAQVASSPISTSNCPSIKGKVDKVNKVDKVVDNGKTILNIVEVDSKPNKLLSLDYSEMDDFESGLDVKSRIPRFFE